MITSFMIAGTLSPPEALESGIDLLTLASISERANLKTVMRCARPSEERKVGRYAGCLNKGKSSLKALNEKERLHLSMRRPFSKLENAL
jgi:hypothetical protein